MAVRSTFNVGGFGGPDTPRDTCRKTCCRVRSGQATRAMKPCQPVMHTSLRGTGCRAESGPG